MSTENRKYERNSYVTPIKFYLIAMHTGQSDKSYGEGVSTDISKGGLGMITKYTLKKGDILYFEPEIRVNDSTESASIVRWVLEIEKYKYRVGTEFIR
jgi:hypothetical protein